MSNPQAPGTIYVYRMVLRHIWKMVTERYADTNINDEPWLKQFFEEYDSSLGWYDAEGNQTERYLEENPEVDRRSWQIVEINLHDYALENNVQFPIEDDGIPPRLDALIVLEDLEQMSGDELDRLLGGPES